MLLALALASSGCGGGGEDEAREVGEQTIAEDVQPPTKFTITEADLSEFPPTSAEHAFVEFWSNAQFQSWDSVASVYDGGLARYIGYDRLVEALKTQATLYRATKPSITRVARDNTATEILYTAENQGNPVSLSMRWRRIDGDWRIEYDPLLDLGLRAEAEARVQATIDPRALNLSPEALKAGAEAARLQSEYLKRDAGQGDAGSGVATPTADTSK